MAEKCDNFCANNLIIEKFEFIQMLCILANSIAYTVCPLLYLVGD